MVHFTITNTKIKWFAFIFLVCWKEPSTYNFVSSFAVTNTNQSFHFCYRQTQKSKIMNVRAAGVTSSIVEKIEDPILPIVDSKLIGPIIRISNHLPAFLSLFYFGLVSMVSMMSKVGSTMMMDNQTAKMVPTTLSSVLTKFVGTTSNAEFSSFFPTLVTPANPVFLVWPLIAAAQVINLSISTIFAALKENSLFSQNDLSALSLSNLVATSWIIISSQSSEGKLPIGSFLVLPIVPLVSGYQLRRTTNSNESSFWISSSLVFQIFSSFTTIASLLALTVELQHGKRILPGLFHNRPELSAIIFLLGYFGILSRREKNGPVKRVVNAVAIVGILTKRITDAANFQSLRGLFASTSFWGTIVIATLAIKQLFYNDKI